MPRATDELRSEFDSDSDALAALGMNFDVGRDGMIRPKQGHIPTPQELRAIDYLFQEWDYGYMGAS